MHELFGAAGDRYEVVTCALTPGPVRVRADFSLLVERGSDALAEADTVIVPAARDPDVLYTEDGDILTSAGGAAGIGGPPLIRRTRPGAVPLSSPSLSRRWTRGRVQVGLGPLDGLTIGLATEHGVVSDDQRAPSAARDAFEPFRAR
ncbi:hypothetical protein GTZ89_42425 [Streptomyces sp. SID8382]|uniref:hypothetical protein n=1 Tax=Streptomyces malaysiensis TaxID=92644 RepID=UPI000C2B715A|nr:transcriptional activator FtrA [Streptomyces sp. M56]MYX62113.1 hypothetical protein [Streptomyces sp. SID8382]